MYVKEPYFLHYKKTWNALDRNVTITTCLVVRLLARIATSKTKIWNNAVRTQSRTLAEPVQPVSAWKVYSKDKTRKTKRMVSASWLPLVTLLPLFTPETIERIWNVTSNVGLSCCSSPKQVWDRFVVISHFRLPQLKPDPNKTLWEKT